MTTRTITFAPGEYYHVYNRGVDKRTIFLDHADHRRFLELLYVANSSKSIDIRSISRLHDSVYDWDRGDQLVAIGTYCLMPNHFHILLTPLTDQGVSLFMNKLCTSYSMYFNKRYQRTGSLFEGKFKAKHATSDTYLKYLFSYIHLNPVKLIQSDWKEKGISDPFKAYDYARLFPYASLMDYLEVTRKERMIIMPSVFPEYFKTAAATQSELMDWLQFGEQE